MPSIQEVIDIVEPVIKERVQTAVICERQHVLKEVLRVLDNWKDLDVTRVWCEANLELLREIEGVPAAPPDDLL